MMDYTLAHNLKISKLTLGTAQLGTNYGIANTQGELDTDQCTRIIEEACLNGITCLDTAPVYGDSEKRIGVFLSQINNYSETPVIITKLPPLNGYSEARNESIYSLISELVDISCRNLHIKQIPIYLLHRAADIAAYRGKVMESLLALKEKGLLSVLGVSVYNPEEIEIALKSRVFEAIQLPLNLFDHRLIESGLLKELRARNYIVFARSLFLQGLFFLDVEAVPPELAIAREPLKVLHRLAVRWNLDVAEIALSFVRDMPEITSMVVGAETPAQILRNIELVKSRPMPAKLRAEIMEIFSGLPRELVNPALWKHEKNF